MRTPRRCIVCCGLAALLLAGCTDVAWLVQQGRGQIEILARAQPIAPLLEAEAVDPELRRRLGLVLAARRFARDALALDVGQQYQNVVFLNAPAVVYVVSAAGRTSLSPYLWRYPLVGDLPYRGSFDLDDAEATANALEEQGYDVAVRPVPTYSLLGILPEPALSTMIFAGDEIDVVETVIHELAHATIFIPGQAAFNEGLATFIGKEGRRRFIEKLYGKSSAIARRMADVDRDETAYVRAVSALAFDLRVLFAQRTAVAPAELLVRKERIFRTHQKHFEDEVAPTLTGLRFRHAQMPANNAELMAYGIYTLRQQLYVEASAVCADDMRCLLVLLRTAGTDPDPETALAELVRARRRPEIVLP